ncbi:SusC/RagA family TonB-linked outer membrane protein [Dysgonomonas sp. GY75]|uniref:SusC/RagA family TonB-linked outer membrane protein n=1 Tax=Dysgonomonas sp. GY75 TaxID=2780419 RepID=UPI00188314D6|nr:SusC/RagA family TonB-linked outer membrane protein [Dysgonomonas sp. GY75]MBF0647391.1 SusC/RagA family TonB-linked outer membrane protein [Dysgonomonas sp. GY75]
MSAGSTTIGQTILEYKNKFGRHDVAALYVGEYTKTWSNYVRGSRDFLFNMEELNLGLATGQKNEGSGSDKNSIGHVGRINYGFDNRYLLELSFRNDASSTYPKVKRWGFFPDASVGWRITEESFMKPYSSVISNLKLRASTSRLGDDASMQPYSDRTGYQTPGKDINENTIPGYIFGSYGGESEFIYPTASSLGIPNDQLTWMIAKTSNIGLDFGLFNNKLTGEIDFFYRSRDGKTATRLTSVPLEFGQKMPQENLNGDSHRGFEILLRHQNRLGNGFFYSVGGNMSFTRAKYEYLEQADATNSYNNWRVNDMYRWMNKRFGYKSAGQFQSYEEIANWAIQDNNGNNSLSPGDIKYMDLNDDDVIDENDQTIIGRNNTPEIMFGLDINLEYKNFDMSILLQGAANFDAYFDSEAQVPFFNGASSLEVFYDRWHREDLFDPQSRWIQGKYPSTYVGGKESNRRVSDFWLQNAAYLRLKNVQIGYTVPKKILTQFKVESLRFYVTAYNILTFTKLDIFDPEVSQGNRGFYYPQQKSYNVGFNLTF